MPRDFEKLVMDIVLLEMKGQPISAGAIIDRIKAKEEKGEIPKDRWELDTQLRMLRVMKQKGKLMGTPKEGYRLGKSPNQEDIDQWVQ